MPKISEHYDPKVLQQLKDIKKEFEGIFDTVKKVKNLKISFDGAKKIADDINKVSTSTENLTKKQIETNKIRKKTIDLIAKTSAERTKEGKKLAELTILRKKQNDKIKEEIRAKDKSVKLTKAEVAALNTGIGSYKRMGIELNKNINKYQSLSEKQRNNRAVGGRLLKTIQKQDRAYKKLGATMGRHQGQVGNYGIALKGLRGLLGALGVTGGLIAFVGIMRKSITIGAQFEKGMSKVQAVSGATSDEFQLLKANAKELGETTEKTASQVAGLQLSLSKLGLTPDQILKSTNAILDLSTATDSDLAQAATVAAATMKGFGKEASEMTAIADVMAESFSSSALDLAKFENSMSKVAPVAKNAGFGLEETTAQLSLLVDRGLEASIAGTSLRNIFLTLSEKGITLEGAMNKIKNATDQNAVALDLFGKRGATAAVIMANNQEEAAKLTTQYENSAGAAKRMADVMRDNLSGDADKAKSAMQGLAIALTERMNPSLRDATQGFTSLVGSINDFLKVKVSEEILNEASAFSLLYAELLKTNPETKERSDLIEEINNTYPDYLSNMDLNTATEGELRNEMILTNQSYLDRFAIQVEQEKIDKESIKLTDERLELAEKEVKLNSEIARFGVEHKLTARLTGKTTEEKIKLIESLKGEQDAVFFLNALYGDFLNKQEDVNEAQDEFTTVAAHSAEIIKSLGGTVKKELDEVNENALDLSKASNEVLLTLSKDATGFVKKAAETELSVRANLEEEKRKASELTADEIKAQQKELIKDTLKGVKDTNDQEIIANKNKFATNLSDEEGYKERSEQLNIDLITNKITKLQELVDAGKVTGDELIAVEDKISKLTVDKAVATVNQKIKLGKEELKDAEELGKAILDAKERTKQREIDKRIEVARKNSKTEEEFRDAVFKINNEILQEEIDVLQKQVDALDDSNKDKIALQEDLKDKQLELTKLTNDGIIRDNDRREELEKQRIDRQKAAIQGLATVTLAISDSIFENRQIKRDEEATAQDEQFATEQEKLEEKHEKDIEAAGNNAALKKSIDQQFEADKSALDKKQAAEKSKLLTEQAQEKKKDALWQIAINTIVAASTTLAQLGLPAAIPALIAVAAAGVASAIAVAAKPIPAFEHGGTMQSDGDARVSEAGSELGIEPSGKMFMTPDKESIMHLKGGTKIVPHHKVIDTLYGNLAVNPQIPKTNDNSIAILDALGKVDRSINNQPQGSGLTGSGVDEYVKRANSTTRYTDRRFRHVRRSN